MAFRMGLMLLLGTSLATAQDLLPPIQTERPPLSPTTPVQPHLPSLPSARVSQPVLQKVIYQVPQPVEPTAPPPVVQTIPPPGVQPAPIPGTTPIAGAGTAPALDLMMDTGQKTLPINLPTALRLANARPIDVALATQRVQAAQAQLDRAHTLWLPTLYLGVDYSRHDGQIQDIVGKVFTTSRSAFMVGGGPSMVFAVTDAIFAPLAARQVVRSREADHQAALNDSVLAVAEAYFNVQTARGEIAGVLDTLRRTEELARRAEGLAEGLIPAVELSRVRTEVLRRRQGVETNLARWEVNSAELNRLLRLPPTSLVTPQEVPHLRTHLIDVETCVDTLIEVGLMNRPELAGRKAQVQATLARLRQEKIRPLIPSVLLRGNATNPAGLLSSGLYGGGINSHLGNFNGRNSLDVQVVWELQNLGFGNLAAVREREAENQQAVLELFRIQDTIAAEVVQAHAQARRALNRFQLAEQALTHALETADKNLEGIRHTRRVGEVLQLVFRPIEVVAALQTLEQCYRDYYSAVGDYNRAQFRLYRAMGHPGQSLLVEQK